MKCRTLIIDGLSTTEVVGRPSLRIKAIGAAIRVQHRSSDGWSYPSWAPTFKSITAATDWLEDNVGDVEGFISESDFEAIMSMYGFDDVSHDCKDGMMCGEASWRADDNKTVQIRLFRYVDGSARAVSYENYLETESCDVKDASEMVKFIDDVLAEYRLNTFQMVLCNSAYRKDVIQCASSSRDLTKNMVRVKSSNIWSYNINIKDRKDKTGDVVVQFKDKRGGPGDIYIYYDVPIMVYRKWHTFPSKGHYFWVYIRNNFKYSKLTGDKRGKLKNAVN